MTAEKIDDALRVGMLEPTFNAELTARYAIPTLPDGPQRADFLTEGGTAFLQPRG
jgi:hypothetical protein